MRSSRFGLLGMAVLMVTAIGVTALAQDAPGAGAGQGARQDRQGRQGGGRGGATLASLPVEVLDSGLKLTADQKAKIAKIHDKYAADLKELQPQAGGQVDPQTR